MLLNCPVAFTAEVTPKTGAGKTRSVDLHTVTTLEVMELSPYEAPVATEWNDRRLMPDGRQAVTRHHDGRHYRLLQERMFDGFHGMSDPVQAARLPELVRTGLTVPGVRRTAEDDAIFTRYRNGKTKLLHEALRTYKTVDLTDKRRRTARVESSVAGLAIIEGQVWYSCSEPCLIVVPPPNGRVVHRILVTTDDDPIHDVVINRGGVKFRADRHEDAVAMIEEAGENPSADVFSSRITIHMPETIVMDDDGAALLRLADDVIDTVGSEVARLIDPDSLSALAELMRSRSLGDLRRLGRALAAMAAAVDLERHGVAAGPALDRWAQRDVEFTI